MAQDQVKKPENPEGEIKKLINAHLLVLKDKLGRPPTSQEIAEALKGEEEQGEPVTQATEETPEDSAEPKVLKLKVYYGQGTKKTDKGVVKAPDPSKVLFYEGHDGRTFDTTAQSWLDQRPPVLDHLPSRPLLFDAKNTDIVEAILHGVVDDEDFTELDKSGAINENTKKIYALQKRTKEIREELEKSEIAREELENNEDTEENENYSDAEQIVVPGDKVQTGINVVRNYMDTAGVQYGLDIVKEEFGEQGADLFTQILQAALADVDEKTRMLVREEMDECLAPVLDAIQALAAHIGVSIDLDDEAGEDTVPQPVDFNEGEEDLTSEDPFSNIDVDEDSP